MATSGAVNTNSYSDAYLRLEWYRTSYDSAAGINYVHWILKGVRSSSGYYMARKFKVTSYNFTTGTTAELYYSESDIQLYNGTVIAEGDDYFTTYADGTCRIQFNIEGAIYTYAVNCTGYDWWDLDTVPRYANITSFSVSKRDLTSVKFNWSADASCDYAWYSTNNGASWSALPNSNIVSGLSPNTGYNFKLRVRRTDSQLTTDSGVYYQTTYDIAKISSAPNLNLGDNELIQYSNPSGSTIKLSIQNTAGTLFYCNDRVVSDSSYIFNFTDQELDTLYKAMGTANSINVRVYLKTFYSQSGYYTDYKQITITLTGNQKTGHIKVNNSWKRGKVWKNVNGTWKRGVVWKNVNDLWCRCI